MNQFLRSLTPTQQVAALFLIVFGLLVIASTTALFLSFRERRNPVHDASWQTELAHFRKLLGTTWFMVIVFWVGWALGETVATVLFALIAFFALREFITLSPTRRGDHRSLILAFFVVLPIQFWLVGTRASTCSPCSFRSTCSSRFRSRAHWPTTPAIFSSATPSCSGASWSASTA
jgi:phosphatidate cytidylyltransferase